MKLLNAAHRYTKALFELARGKQKTDLIFKDLQGVQETLQKNPKALAVFHNPAISKKEKKMLIEKIFLKTADALTCRFLAVLIEKNRFDLLETITRDYEHLLDEQNGLVKATVHTAHPLTHDLLSQLQKALERKIDKKVLLQIVNQPALLGGLKIQMGNLLIDGSLQTQLNELRTQLLGTQVA